MESNKSLLWEKDCLAQRNLEELITSKIITSKMRHAAVEKLGRSTNDARLKEILKFPKITVNKKISAAFLEQIQSKETGKICKINQFLK